jgi:hypothetical protein
MKWRTEVEIPGGTPKIRYTDAIITLGSCFADHLGSKLSYYQFPCMGNPFGVIFHPVPMANLLRRAVEGRSFTPDDLFSTQNRWGSLQTHTSLSGNTPEEASQVLNRQLDALGKALKDSTHLVLTLGTAYGYRNLENGHLVANCHKLPGTAFERELTPVKNLMACLEEICALARSFNREMTCLFTVSPIRHLRDGLVENQRSKAHLITAVHQVVDKGLADYFPSYEIFMDELRDYRFYDRDLIHPSEQAVDFVWEQFESAWIHGDAKTVMQEVDAIRRGLAHRPIHQDSAAHREFRETLAIRVKRLQEKHPYMSF